MRNYFYAYHGPKNKDNFDFKKGYGVSGEKTLKKVKVGDFVFIIQNLNKSFYELCGLYEIVKIQDTKVGKLRYRVELRDLSNLDNLIQLDEQELSKLLPKATGDKRRSNFQRHFCKQNYSFQRPLDNEVISILKSLLPKKNQLQEHLDDFDEQVKEALNSSKEAREERLRKSSKKPEKLTVTTTFFKRNPDVVAEALIRANGVCQGCNQPAPFIRRKDGTPYLEVHHKIKLANGGDDTVENTIALCPNCHREEHFG
ncbi:HNH endonuclease signature motif containing protein [Pseudoalteromonas sp. MEBiC 03485]|uniref:HNH endonuclease n=2 Tax=unclassified Pseudoalteromonas TaxID=194690 RepID=UPI001022447A|nr:HNH endonuclease signature motif containing protein [Pseudoalteromonas sp. MEBiC 03485]RZD20310.1 HNH endonuclease [Pseudoalteromonas sp. MEBiC 03485]